MPRPQVGIFWYDESRRELFGALSEYKTYTSCDWTGMKSYPGLHRNVWKKKQKEYFDTDGKYVPDDKYPDAASNPWCAEDYTKVPRGRIYTDGETFFVYVGTWFDKDSERIASLIVETYGLDDGNTRFVHNQHWSVGNGWEELKIRKRRYRGNPRARKHRKQK